jgi:hypothetical protein
MRYGAAFMDSIGFRTFRNSVTPSYAPNSRRMHRCRSLVSPRARCRGVSQPSVGIRFSFGSLILQLTKESRVGGCIAACGTMLIKATAVAARVEVGAGRNSGARHTGYLG